MGGKKQRAVLDGFRVLCAFLVVAIHTSPLLSVSETADFVLTRVFARVAVPFFFVLTGYFMAPHLEASDRDYRNRFLKKIAAVYGLSMLLYLPLNLYSGYFGEGFSGGKVVLDILFGGTFYHLWYLPAVLFGVWFVWLLVEKAGFKRAFFCSAILYLIGLFGDSYYGLASEIPAVKALYDGIFSISEYTRNGLFFAPIFLLTGAGCVREEKVAFGKGVAGSAVLLALMTGEGLTLYFLGLQRHDSMYILLIPLVYLLFQTLRALDGCGRKAFRDISLLIYVLHPWFIVLVRGAAKVLKITPFFVENSLIHYLAVCAATFFASIFFYGLAEYGKTSGKIARISGKERPGVKSRAWVEIEGEAIRHNMEEIRRLLPERTGILGVLKADAYGHGAVKTARILEAAGAEGYAVACLSEAVALRKAGIKGEILILGWTDPKEAGCLARYRLTQTVVDAVYARMLSHRGIPLKVHVKIDTGMHRLGVSNEAYEEITKIFRCRNLKIEGIFSHLCVSDTRKKEDLAYTETQIQRYFDLVGRLKRDGYPVGRTHIQASYGILNYPNLNCDLARPGLILYGIKSDSQDVLYDPDLKPALALKARVALVRDLEPGERAGYGRVFCAKDFRRLGVVTIGYGDGVPRNYAEAGGEVLLKGSRAPIVGRICMDQLLVDVTEIPGVKAGDTAVLIGKDGNGQITCEEMAEKCGTITNEILSRLGNRLLRIYVEK
ncbi:MAG: serine racemase VanT catalytic subunit [Lachnospiraceae bacterium]|nr:serine racemase VanT catalytic subunit [Lachnospiraceae bacterium]